MVAIQKFDIGGLLPEGSKVEAISIKAPEDAEDKAARFRRDFWSFVGLEVGGPIDGQTPGCIPRSRRDEKWVARGIRAGREDRRA